MRIAQCKQAIRAQYVGSCSKCAFNRRRVGAIAAPQEPVDGLDNKDRWHWKERDLRAWVNDWLMAAFVQVHAIVCITACLVSGSARFRLLY